MATSTPIQSHAASPRDVVAWSWRPSRAAYFAQLREAITAWAPDPEIVREPDCVRGILDELAAVQADVLLHPCMSALTDPSARGRWQRDVQLAVWAAAEAPDLWGDVQLPEGIWLWRPDGGVQVPAGTHDLAELGHLTRSASAPVAIALDVWCCSLATPLRDSWAEAETLLEADLQRLRSEVGHYLCALEWLAASAPDILDWAAAVTRVVIPLAHAGGPQQLFHSGSSPEIPGMIYCDLFAGELQILEALVHESAHLHLFLAEAEAPLIQTHERDAYPSPLRSEPRPLRGVLMACHALAYICLLYRRVVSPKDTGRGAGLELDSLRASMLASFETLLGARSRFTAHGHEFLVRLEEVVHVAA